MVSLILIFISGLFNGLMDKLRFKWQEVPDWMKKREWYWNPTLSWRNKYKDDDDDGVGDFGAGPRFLFSTTFLVSFTDGWHTMKTLMKVFFILAIVFYVGKDGFFFNTPILRIMFDYILCFISFQIGFSLMYKTNLIRCFR